MKLSIMCPFLSKKVIIGTEKVEIDGEEYEYFTRTSDDVEIVKEDGVYYFTRPAGKATVKAVFKPEGTAGVTISGKVTSFGTGTTTVELLDENGNDAGFTPCTGSRSFCRAGSH